MLSAVLMNTESSLLHMNCQSGWRSFNSEEMVINTCMYFRLCTSLMPTERGERERETKRKMLWERDEEEKEEGGHEGKRGRDKRNKSKKTDRKARRNGSGKSLITMDY